MWTLDDAICLSSRPRPRPARVQPARPVGHFITFAVVTGLTTGTLVMMATLMGSL